MAEDSLFDSRKIIAYKLLAYIKDAGYTKVSFSKKTGISRPTLDRLFNNEMSNKVSFDKHMNKILDVLNISGSDLLYYKASPQTVEVVYSQNAPKDSTMSDKARKEYELLLDLVDLTAIYC